MQVLLCAFDHICMEKARNKFLIIIIIIIFKTQRLENHPFFTQNRIRMWWFTEQM